jgi:hypothetical protein
MVQDFEEYGAWRERVASSLGRYQAWAAQAELSDGASQQRIERALARLADDKLSVAFVAEFSRGKSELINAIFFADYGQRILPSAAGRTTMCPTELMYDPAYPPCIRLLPIETRAENLSTSDYRDTPDAWTVFGLDLNAGEAMPATGYWTRTIRTQPNRRTGWSRFRCGATRSSTSRTRCSSRGWSSLTPRA